MVRRCATKSRLFRTARTPARSAITSTTLPIICGGSAWILRNRKSTAVASFRCTDLRSKIQRASRESMKSALAVARTGSASSAASTQCIGESTNVTVPAPASCCRCCLYGSGSWCAVIMKFRSQKTKGTVNSEKLSVRSEEHTSELQSLTNLVCRLLLEKKKNRNKKTVVLKQTLLTTRHTKSPHIKHSAQCALYLE